MGRYDDLEFASLIDAVQDLAGFYRGTSGDESQAIRRVLLELSHALVVFQEPGAARDAEYASANFDGGNSVQSQLEDLQESVDDIVRHFSLESEDCLDELITGAMWLPVSWTEEAVLDLIKKTEASNE